MKLVIDIPKEKYDEFVERTKAIRADWDDGKECTLEQMLADEMNTELDSFIEVLGYENF